MTRRRIILTCGAGAAVLLGVITAVMQYRRGMNTYFIDGQSIRVQHDEAMPRTILWQPPTQLDDFESVSTDEYEPRLSADGTMLYLVRGRAGENADIFVCHRQWGPSASWSEPQPVLELNSGADELGPEISADGLVLYFYSNRSGGEGGYDVWFSRRDGDQWAEPVNAGPGVNTPFNEYGLALHPDGLRLSFSSNRPREGESPTAASPAWSATLRENLPRHDYDLYSASITDGVIGGATAVPVLNSLANEGAPAFSPVGDFLYFCSDRENGQGGYDVYRARLLGDEFLNPLNLGVEVNSPWNEMDPAPSENGFALHFSSDRLAAGDAGMAARYKLYRTQSREVFAHVDDSPIDWAGLATVVLPFLLWLLSALLALLFIIFLWRGSRSGKLSLLARCLLASLIAHLVLMLLLTFWDVTGSLGNMLKRGGDMRVAVTSAGAGDGLAAQIRGTLTDVRMSPAAAPLSSRVIEQISDAGRSTAIPKLELGLPQVALNIKAMTDRMLGTDSKVAMEQVRSRLDVPRIDHQLSSVRVNEAPVGEIRSEQAVSAPRIAQPPDAARDRSADSFPAQLSQALIVSLNAARIAPNLTGESNAIDESVSDAAASSSGTHVSSSLALEPTDDIIGSLEVAIAPMPQGAPARADEEASAAIAVMQPSQGSHASERVNDVTAPRASSEAAAGVHIMPQPINASALESTVARIGARAEESDTVISTPDGADGGVRSAVEPTSLGSATALAVEARMPDSEVLGAGQLSDTEASIGPAKAIGAGDSSRVALGFVAPASTSDASISLAPVEGANSRIGDAADKVVGASKDVATDASPWGGSLPIATDLARTVPGDALDLDLKLPDEIAPPVNPYVQRSEEVRRDVVEHMGGSEATEKAVSLALQWLVAHQAPDGRWAAADFEDDCGECGGKARFDTDIATTGLALLCLLGADHTHVKDGPYRDQVRRGIEWLRGQMKDDGDLRGSETMYSHGIATIALSEAFGMTGDGSLREPVRNAVDFIARARNTSQGGWRYEPGQYGDTSVLGWQVMALISARRAGLSVAEEVLDTAKKWMDRVSISQRPGRYCYQPGQRFTPSMTAEGLFVQQLLGVPHDEPRMSGSVQYVMENLPQWSDEANTYYWYYATLALYQHQGDSWRQWNESITRTLLDNQRTDGPAAGSWDPADNWSRIGGRVYQTALCTLCLEVYYRYLPMYANVPLPHAAP